MGVIGNLGPVITFEVSADKILTFEKMTRTVKSRWGTHQLIGAKTKSEWLGADPQTISLSILLSASHGVSPRATLERLERAIELGEEYPFVLGERRIGSNNWAVTEMSESWDVIFQGGILIQAKVSMTLQEIYLGSTSIIQPAAQSDTGQASGILGTYTVVSGDCLWNIAKKYYGSGGKYLAIYNANKELIESTARAHGKKNSGNGHRIWPGMVLTIPEV